MEEADDADVTDATSDVTVDGDVMTVDIADTKTVDEVETERITGARAVENTTDGVVDEISVDDDVPVVAVVVVRVAGTVTVSRYGDWGWNEIGSDDMPERVCIGDDIV